MLIPDERAELRESAEHEQTLTWIDVDTADLLALLDAADGRDRLTAGIKRVRAWHSVEWICENSRHTNPEVDCPECRTVCTTCGDDMPCTTLTVLDALDGSDG